MKECNFAATGTKIPFVRYRPAYFVFSSLLLVLAVIYFMPTMAQDPDAQWQKPPEEVMNVLHAPQLPWIWTAPTGDNLFLAEPSDYPTLAEMTGHDIIHMFLEQRTHNALKFLG